MCDLNNTQANEDNVKLLQTVSVLLRPGGYIIWTIKLMKRSEQSKALEATINKTVNVFQQYLPNFSTPQVKWLLANKCERTLVATKSHEIAITATEMN